jgi:hypothetical protein
VPQNLLGSLRRLYYETAMSANPSTLIALAPFVSTDRILFGADYPFMPESDTAETITGARRVLRPPGPRQHRAEQRGRPRTEAGSHPRLARRH